MAIQICWRQGILKKRKKLTSRQGASLKNDSALKAPLQISVQINCQK